MISTLIIKKGNQKAAIRYKGLRQSLVQTRRIIRFFSYLKYFGKILVKFESNNY